MRRIERIVLDIISGRKTFPNHLGTLTLVTFFTGIIYYGISIGGHGQITMRNFTSIIGFSVDDVKVLGNIETSDIDILHTLALEEKPSLLTLDLGQAYKQLSSLPWVKKTELLKVYPASLHINLVERQAFGIWQYGNRLSLIERDGHVIEGYDGTRYTDLPLFVGAGASLKAAGIYDILSNWPDFLNQTKAIIRVADRRWDLRLKNGITIHLPEREVEAALEHLQAYDKTHDVLRRDIAQVDLRLSDRVTIRLTPEALARRNSAISERTSQRIKAMTTGKKV